MKGQPLSVHGNSLGATDFLHMKTDAVLRQLHDHPSITKAVGIFLSMVLSKQLNAAPYLRHKPWQLLWEETVPAFVPAVP